MEQLIKMCQALVHDEYATACMKYGPVNASNHHSYAVILEELEEAVDEALLVKKTLDDFWRQVKSKSSTVADMRATLANLQARSVLSACEMIQVSAMAHKAILTLNEKGKQLD